MTDAEDKAGVGRSALGDNHPVPPTPNAECPTPALPPRWVRRIVIGGAVAGSLVVALPSVLWLLLRRRKAGESDLSASGTANVTVEVEEEGEPKRKRRSRKTG